jgi:hypothetical protein
VGRTIVGHTALVAASVFAVAGTAVYVISRTVRLFVSFSVMLAVAGLVLFVAEVSAAARNAEVAAIQPAKRPPIVVIVLDELPLSSLLTRQGTIDAVRYPSFAHLARRATWYRNATTVHDFTTSAVPAILTGRRQRHHRAPLLAQHPNNLFTLLGSSYDLNVHEEWTRLCPLALCPMSVSDMTRSVRTVSYEVGVAYLHKILPTAARRSLPPPFTAFEPSPVERYAAALSQEPKQEKLHFIHMVTPHHPWRFLPSGRAYRATRLPDGLESDVWIEAPWVVAQAYQAHLLQVGYADALLGQLLRALELSGRFDDALVVVVADHGASFRPGRHFRSAYPDNLADIASVPFFVKYPNQLRGSIELRRAETIDVLPTIADVLGIELPWQLDGRSLLAAPTKPSEVVVNSVVRVVQAPAGAIARECQAAVSRKAALFGEGEESLYWIGTGRSLVGTQVRRNGAEGARRITASQPSPVLVSGRVDVGELRPEDDIVVAVEGRVVANTRWLGVGQRQRFSALIPEEALEGGGEHRIDVYAARRGKSHARLVWLGTVPSYSRS